MVDIVIHDDIDRFRSLSIGQVESGFKDSIELDAEYEAAKRDEAFKNLWDEEAFRRIVG